MIRVLHVVTGLRRGGAETMLVKLVGAIDRARFENRVICLAERGPLAAALEQAGAAVEAFGMRSGLDPRPLWRLVAALRRHRPDVIQTWLYHADLAGLVAAMGTGRSRRLLWNLRCSDMELRRYAPSLRLVVRLLARLSPLPAGIVVNSRAGRLHHQRLGYRPRRWIEIPNGFDLSYWRPDDGARGRLRAALGLAENAPLIGMVARLDPMKDHATFLAAFAAARRHLPDLHAVLIGRGTESLDAAIAAQGLAGAVATLGERDDVRALLCGCDVACLSSAFGEGFPNVLGEAMACGVPCVATDIGDAAEIIGGCGRIVPARQPEALAEAFLALLRLSPEARRQLGMRGRDRIAARYDLAGIAARYEELYAEIAGRR